MSLARVVLNDIGTLANGASARQALNDNFQKIEDEFKKVVYRDGSTPNSMEADLDMDSHRILNVADAVHDKDAVNKGQVADIAYEAAEVVWQPRYDDFVNHVEDELSRTLKLPPGYTNMALPAPEPSRLIGWNAAGTALRNTDLSGPGDLTLRSDLADPTGGAALVQYDDDETVKDRLDALADADDAVNHRIDELATGLGASLIGFQQAGSGAVQRTVQGKLYDLPVHLLDFVPEAEHAAILNGTSTYDCGPALANAIAAAQSNSIGANVVLLPKGLINTSQTFTITSPVRLVGQGGAPAPGYSTFPTELGTTIKYTGTDTNATLFTFKNVNYGGAGLYHLGLNGNGVAYRGLILDGVLGFSSEDLNVARFTNVLVGLISTGGTTSWNQFKNLFMNGVDDGGVDSACLWLSGGDGPGGTGSNACHCTFENVHINHGGTRHGILLGGCDNITFLQTYIYRSPGGTGYGVKVEFSLQDGYWFPVANTFYHLQSGDGGWFEPAGGSNIYPTAVIYGYQTDNGQPLPVTNGRRLPYITNSGDIIGVKSIGRTGYSVDWGGTVLATSGSTSTAVTFSWPGSSDNYNVIINSPTTIGYAIQNKTASGFTIAWASPLPQNYNVDWLVLVR